MDLNLIFKELRACARSLGSYETIAINDLANGYCIALDTNDEQNKDIYFSALVMRFWYKINKMYQENLTLNLEYADYYDGLVDAIQQACAPDARAWQRDGKLNAQQVINQILSTRFIAQKYYESNLQKNLGKNFTMSLDAPLDREDEEGNTLGDILIEEDATTMSQDNSQVYGLIQDYINNNKLIEAIIIDNIAFKESIKYDKEIIKYQDEEGKQQKYTKYYTEFWPYKVIKELSSIDDKYKNYFKNTYNVSEPAIEAAFKAIGKANSQKKYKYLEATQRALKLDFGL